MIDSRLPIKEQIKQLIEWSKKPGLHFLHSGDEVTANDSPAEAYESGYWDGDRAFREKIVILLQCILNSEIKP